jgi:hypothetical protein
MYSTMLDARLRTMCLNLCDDASIADLRDGRQGGLVGFSIAVGAALRVGRCQKRLDVWQARDCGGLGWRKRQKIGMYGVRP